MPDIKREMSGNGDRRVRRTRAALIGAWNRLVLGRRKRDIKVGDIIAEAGVGRSTFYDHYQSAQALHLDALRRPFGPLADAAAGKGQDMALAHILEHFWDYRERARRTLGEQSQRLLAEMVEERLGSGQLLVARPIAARQLAASAHAAVGSWLSGEAPCSAEVLAKAIARSGEAQVRALKA